MATVTLTNRADYYDASGSYRNDTTYALSGEDTLYLGYGRDIAFGGNGADYISGGDGNDTLGGGDGFDTLYGGNGFDRLNGDKGNDYIFDYDQNGIYNGGDGNDTIHVHGGYVNAGTGADVVELHGLGSATSTVILGAGADTLRLGLDAYYDGVSSRIVLKDFKAEDHLTLDGYGTDGGYLDAGQMLDGFDRNNDGWLGLKDVEQYNDGDGFEVVVNTNSLELHFGQNSIYGGDTLVFAGITKASFDFLS